MSKYLLFICPGGLFPAALVALEADKDTQARETAKEAIDMWVETGKEAGSGKINRPKAYLTLDVGSWL